MKITNDELLENMKSIAINNTLLAKDYAKKGKVHSATIIERFGSWEEALKQANLKSGRKLPVILTNDQLKEDMLRVANGSKTLSVTKYNTEGKSSDGVLRKRFGSFREALATVDLSPSELRISYTDEEVYVINSPITSASLRRRLLSQKVFDYKCVICKINSWNNKELTLQVDHINGINNDNRKENLRLLCANCHSQTDTYAGKQDGYKHGRARNARKTT